MDRKSWFILALIILLLSGCAATKQVSKVHGDLGYRVQIFFTESMDEAQKRHDHVQAEVRSKDYAVYTVFEAPYYKVRVGDFLLKDDAYEAQTWLRNALGYSDAWVVPSKVVIK